ncbi:molybdenum cofactor biosynthesis protein MoaE [Chitinolyticbacter meiyuanensis]|uniref:molybdenum cofactor biosynthesis protein MoaE n=1 Tax=Chitinolyticbacter meiyuanensis TaxID=682798 RepID=UPI0011E5DF2B|nr:molybdenum cofactor biosynthesis protein MoaE [Chitinolyticbacter meiyuanensis]
MSRIRIVVGPDDFDLSRECAALIQHDIESGAVAAFVGRVRDFGPDSVMTLEHYPGMTEKALAAIVDAASARWPLSAVTVIHRVGPLAAGAQIVLVLTASRHRRAAYDANAYIMDYLKTEAPFWKLEETGAARTWVEAKAKDNVERQRWDS